MYQWNILSCIVSSIPCRLIHTFALTALWFLSVDVCFDKTDQTDQDILILCLVHISTMPTKGMTI